MSVTHLLWAPSLAVGGTLAAASGASGETLAAVLGGIAAVISAVTGLVVALKRRDPQIVVVSPEEVADLQQRRKRRRS